MATAKKTTKKKSTVKASSAPSPIRSLQRSGEDSPFLTFRITQQSVYWLILSMLVLGLGIWVVTLSVKVQTLYDEIDISSIQNDSFSVKKH